MKVRLISHLALFTILIGIGAWIAYRGVTAPTQLGPLEINLETAVVYWFAVLMYGLMGLVLYYPLRGRSPSVLILGHSVAAAIALTSTTVVVALGSRYSSPSADAAVADSEAGEILPDAGAPPGQPLPLPEPDQTTEPQPGPSSPPENP